MLRTIVIGILLGLLGALFLGSVHAMDHGFQRDTARSEFFQHLKRPDYYPGSCCGKADAYEADIYQRNSDGSYEVTITDGSAIQYPDGTKLDYIPNGTTITVPKDKDQSSGGDPAQPDRPCVALHHGIRRTNRLHLLLCAAARRIVTAHPQLFKRNLQQHNGVLMASVPVPDDELQKAVDCLRANSGNQIRAAAALGLSRGGLQDRLRRAETRNIVASGPIPDKPLAPTQIPLDVVERHRLTSEIDMLRAANRALTKRIADAEDHRASILGLGTAPAEPTAKPRSTRIARHASQAVVLHLSDLHVGEVVNREEVMGVNQYDLTIAERRIGRLFNAAAVLSTTAWPASDAPPVKVCVLLGGDLISGHGLHPEHAETDAGTAYQQVKWAAEYIAAGVLRLHVDTAERFGKSIPIELISVVGNHGRDTFGKPRTKLVSIQSYDTLVSDFVEAALKHIKTITHYRPRGFDAYFDAVGWPLLLTHGDRMGSGGGTGFIGPAATIIKGHRKIIDTEHRQRRPVYKVFSGHFHTTCVTPFGFGNGSGIGYGEFAKSLRADPEPAQQNYVVFHERIGVLRWHPIAMGSASEGSIYQPTAGLILPDKYEARA